MRRGFATLRYKHWICGLFVCLYQTLGLSEGALVGVVRSYGGSVVHISSPETQLFRAVDLYRHYFGRDFFPTGPTVSLGSGVLLDHEGHVLTTYDQVRGFAQFTITDKMGKNATAAKIRGVDPVLGIALLKTVTPLKGASIVDRGRSETLLVGDVLIAIGNPFGKGLVAEFGHVTGLEKFAGSGPLEAYVHTDMNLHPGVMGGVILDQRGRWVGVAARKEVNGRYNMMLPEQRFEKSLSYLRSTGKVVRPWLGVDLKPRGELDSTKQDNGGVVVSNLIFDGPSQRAGLRIGDLIVKMDDERIQGQGHFSFLLSTKPLGKPVRLLLFRQGVGDVNLDVLPIDPPKAQDLPNSDSLF
jgi:S1-C subfamily serine protease